MSDHITQAKQAFKWTLYLRTLSQMVTWAVSLVVIRFLAPSDYAVVALTEIVFTLVLLLCSSGLGDALIQQTKFNERFNRKILNLLVVLTTMMSLALFLLAPQLAMLYHQPLLTTVFRLCSVVFLCTPWLVLASSILARQMDFKSRGQVDLLSAVCTSLVSLLLAWQGFGFWALILSSLLNIILRAIGYTLIVRRFYLPLFDFDDVWPSLKFGLTVAATSLMFGLFIKIDILLAGLELDVKTLGYYALAMHLAILPMAKIMPLVNEVAYPMYTNIRHQPGECHRIFVKVLGLISFTMLPVYVLLAAVAEPAVVLVLGKQWQPVAAPMQLILLTIPLRMLSNLFSPLLKALGHPVTGLQHVTISSVLVATAVYIAAPYGLMALAWSWLVVTPLMLAFALWLVTRRSGLPFRFLWRAVHRPLFISALTFGLVQLLEIPKVSNLEQVVTLLVKGCVGIAIYLTLSWFFNQSQFREVLSFRLSDRVNR